MNSIDMQVEGMSCGACVRHVNAALLPLAGVSEVAVDLAAGRVKVTGNADSALLLAALQEAGYPARVHAPQGPAVARKACCGCCG